MDEEFFTKYGVNCKTEEDFKAEVVKNMERELNNSVSNKLKTQLVTALSEQNDVAIPGAMVEQEINRMKQEAVQQFGGGQQLDPSKLPLSSLQGKSNSVQHSHLL